MIPKAMTDRARELRVSATSFEASFWDCVRGKRLAGYKFRRQVPIGPFIADFACMNARFIVELDGTHHQETKDGDVRRDAWLKTEGFRVFRVKNADWAENPKEVLEQILKEMGHS